MYFHSSIFKNHAYNLLSILVIASLLLTYVAPAVAHAEDASSTPAVSTDQQTDPPVSDGASPDTTTTDTTTDTTDTPSGDAVVVTGDAVSSGDVQNGVNTNVIDTGSSTPDTSSDTTTDGTSNDTLTTDNASETPQTLSATNEADTTPATPVNVDATSTNDATVANNADVDAGTGDNTASTSADSAAAVVATGNAVAVANVVNVVNTNIFDAQGFFLFLSNLLAGFGGTLDLRTLGFFDQSGTGDGSSCDGTCGDIANGNISNSNNADITNNVTVGADTGGNTATSSDGGALVVTGNAYAAANVINVANTNIVDSNYLLLTFNNFGDFNGDVVFPAAQAFLDIFGGGQGTGAATVSNNNSASVSNNVSANANTGDNSASSSGGNAAVVTGDASAGANVVNQVNSNLFGGGGFSVLFRIHGDWGGQIFGAPPGLTWQQTPGGVQLFFDPSAAGSGSVPPTVNNLNLSNTNDANITNNVNVYALTGNNQALGGAGAGVSTGDAYADANLINVANTNIVGRNWMLAIFDIFGNWNGSISFGRPDLLVASRLEMIGTDRVRSGDSVIYHFMVANNGDIDAHNVTVTNTFDPDYVVFPKEPGGFDGKFTENVGTIPAGQYQEFSFEANINKNIPIGQSAIANTVSVIEDEPDDNMADNTDLLSYDVTREAADYMHGAVIEYTPSPRLAITKTNSTEGATTSASTTISYEVNIENSGGGPAYGAVLVDTLKDAYGHVIYQKHWEIGTIKSGEKVVVDYDVFFSGKTPTGTYTNTAKVYALAGYPTFIYGHDGSSNEASSVIHIKALPPPEEPASEEPAVEEVPEEPAPQPGIIDESIQINHLLHAVQVVAEQARHLFLSMPLYLHPVLADRIPRVADLPLYLHPIYPPRARVTTVYDEPQPYADVVMPMTPSWVQSIAGIGFTKLILAPGANTVSTSEGSDTSSPEERNHHVLALLALSMFVLRPSRQESDPEGDKSTD